MRTARFCSGGVNLTPWIPYLPPPPKKKYLPRREVRPEIPYPLPPEGTWGQGPGARNGPGTRDTLPLSPTPPANRQTPVEKLYSRNYCSGR